MKGLLPSLLGHYLKLCLSLMRQFIIDREKKYIILMSRRSRIIFFAVLLQTSDDLCLSMPNLTIFLMTHQMMKKMWSYLLNSKHSSVCFGYLLFFSLSLVLGVQVRVRRQMNRGIHRLCLLHLQVLHLLQGRRQLTKRHHQYPAMLASAKGNDNMGWMT